MPAGQVARGPRRKGKPLRAKNKAGPSGGGAGPIALASALCAAGVALLFGFRKRSKHVLLDQLRDREVLDDMMRKPMSYTGTSAAAMCLTACGLARLLPCPKVVVDASVGVPTKRVQNVFSACPHYTGVITVIDQDTNWTCL